MTPDDKIYVAGHTGLAGSALVRRLRQCGYYNVVTRTHGELDLVDQHRVEDFFARERPRYVLMAAARVGGILANSTHGAEFIYQNLMIETNIIHTAYRFGVRKLVFLGSSCVYPKYALQPIKEEYLLTGPLEETNEPYAVAKIAGIKMCAAYNRQYGTDFLCVMPTNLYGPGDSYDSEKSHVIPALIDRMHKAKLSGEREVYVWGTGKPRRELLYSDDFANACLILLERACADEIGECINIGTGSDHTVSEIAELVAEAVGLRATLKFDPTKPDGTPRKLLDSSRIRRFGWEPRTSLRQGLAKAYEDYLSRASDASR